MNIKFLCLVLLVTSGCATTPSPMAIEIAKSTQKNCGASYSLTNGNRLGSNDYVVSVYPEPGRTRDIQGELSAADVHAFIERNKDLLSLEGHAVGTWCEIDGGDCHVEGIKPVCHLDVSRTLKTLKEAEALAKACNQIAIAWLKADGAQIIDNDGLGYGDGKPLSGKGLEACRKARKS